MRAGAGCAAWRWRREQPRAGELGSQLGRPDRAQLAAGRACSLLADQRRRRPLAGAGQVRRGRARLRAWRQAEETLQVRRQLGVVLLLVGALVLVGGGCDRGRKLVLLHEQLLEALAARRAGRVKPEEGGRRACRGGRGARVGRRRNRRAARVEQRQRGLG